MLDNSINANSLQISIEYQYMNTRKLGQSTIDISTIGLGANYVGGHNLYKTVDEDEGVRLVQRAIDLGANHIDTADAYGFGRSEELVGKALAGRRDDVVLATKGGVMFGEFGKGVNNDPAYLRQALERSLKRLNVDYIDLYYIHKYDEKTPIEDSFGALMDFKSEGLIRAAGVSNFDLKSLQSAAKTGPVDALQSRYNLLQREVELDVLPWCVDNNTSFIPWGCLAYGLLGGRYERDFTLDEQDWRHRTGMFAEGVYESNLQVVDGLKRIAQECESTPAALAIQWLLARPGVSSVIAGAKSSDQVDLNVAIDDLELTAQQLSTVDALTSSRINNRSL